MQNKTVLITGCSSGFGKLLVDEYLNRGWNVIATMRHASTRPNVLDNSQKTFGNQLAILNLDVTNSVDRATAVKFIEDKFGGGLDCLINNAGFAIFGPFEEASEEQVRNQMEVNFFGLVLMTKGLLPSLRKNHGRVINLSSALGYTGMPMNSLYCASKFAVEGFSEALYYELKPFNVQVTLVEPGGHRTSFADNAQWTEKAFETNSPYMNQTKAFRNLHYRLKTRTAVPAARVVKTIITVSECKKAPLRVRCGADAMLLNMLKRLLPAGILTGLLIPIYQKMLEQKVVEK